MSGSLNCVMLIGNLGKDPEVRRLNNGGAVVSMSIATSESWTDKQTGEKREKVEWSNVVIFNENIGKVAEKYLRKGSKVFVQGKLQTRKWQDKEGKDRYSTEVVLGPFNSQLTLLDSKEKGEARGSSLAEEAGEVRPAGAAPAGGRRQSLAEELDDEIPFASSDGIW